MLAKDFYALIGTDRSVNNFLCQKGIVQIDECLLQGKRKSNKGRYRLSDHPY